MTRDSLFSFLPWGRLLSRESYPTICPADGEGCHCDEGVGDELCEPRPCPVCQAPPGYPCDAGLHS